MTITSSDIVKITAIVCLCIIEIVALFKSIDGILFGAIIIAISGLAGYELARRKNLHDTRIIMDNAKTSGITWTEAKELFDNSHR